MGQREPKSAALAIILNIVWPGAAYLYCGPVLLGVFYVFAWPVLAVAVAVTTMGMGLLILYPCFIIDAALTAGRTNDWWPPSVHVFSPLAPFVPMGGSLVWLWYFFNGVII